MNMNYNYLTKIYRSILTQIYVFLVLFTIFHFVNIHFSTRNLNILAKIVVHVHATVFSKVHAACHNIANGIKPGIKVSKGAKIKNQYNQVPHLTQDTNGKVTNLQ